MNYEEITGLTGSITLDNLRNIIQQYYRARNVRVNVNQINVPNGSNEITINVRLITQNNMESRSFKVDMEGLRRIILDHLQNTETFEVTNVSDLHISNSQQLVYSYEGRILLTNTNEAIEPDGREIDDSPVRDDIRPAQREQYVPPAREPREHVVEEPEQENNQTEERREPEQANNQTEERREPEQANNQPANDYGWRRVIRRGLRNSFRDARRDRNEAALAAGTCVLLTAASVYFNGQDVNQTLIQNMAAINSWETLGQFFQTLGPLTTLLSAGTLSTLGPLFNRQRRLNRARRDLEDFEDIAADEMGGNANARTR